MKNWIKIILILFVLLFAGFSVDANVAAEEPVVRAILFFSPTCPHCHVVINEVLPEIKGNFPEQVQVIGVDVSKPKGGILYQEFISAWQISEDRLGVPGLVVGDTYLVGESEIPTEFPGIIEQGLLAGGIDWPDIPGIEEILVSVDPQLNRTEVVQITNPTMLDRFKQDLSGNILAVVVLLAMVFSFFWILLSVIRSKPEYTTNWSWVIPVLSVVGLFVAGYLSFVEVTNTEAVCGPVGNCNAVQTSQYAKLYGVLPIGILGLFGYVGILAAWLLGKYGPESWRGTLSMAVWGMAFFGVIFSIYLTFLEPFVIGATCIWCISSAIVITLQLWAATGPFQKSMADQGDDDYDEDEMGELGE